ncbi:MBL fold metallo-hydrolase [Palleronia sediminis]|uniref:MBL fold metallo-hydrolase n=1 Tax=Palleronia sediminis TaxID=2547833 RepID=A0A4R6AIU3_9RHOB|nr:MBL fold metallo-hydrolase [Palleronia sediminis]TDL81606.1 MBL fold metallo-hydrolase [Palleronia sediminis]
MPSDRARGPRPEPLRFLVPSPPRFGAPVEIAPGLRWLRLPLPMALDHVNCWMLDEGAGVAVVDTGLDTRRTRALWRAALDGRRVTRVLCTHHHPDHMGLAGWFAETHGAEILMPRTGWLTARRLQRDVQDRPAPETVAFWRAAGMDAAILSARLAERPFNLADVTAPLPPGHTRLRGDTRIVLGGRRWTVRMGEGHAPEHATLWDEAGGIVLGGDQMLPSISPNLSVYPSAPEADPVGDWLASCARLRGHARDGMTVLPGHGLPYRGLARRLGQMIDNHLGALDRLRAHLARPRTACACFTPLFGREIGAGAYGLALGEAVAHCQHLVHRGETRRDRDPATGAWLYRMANAGEGADLPR